MIDTKLTHQTLSNVFGFFQHREACYDTIRFDRLGYIDVHSKASGSPLSLLNETEIKCSKEQETGNKNRIYPEES